MPNKTSEVKNQTAKSRKKSAVSEADELNKAAESDVNEIAVDAAENVSAETETDMNGVDAAHDNSEKFDHKTDIKALIEKGKAKGSLSNLSLIHISFCSVKRRIPPFAQLAERRRRAFKFPLKLRRQIIHISCACPRQGLSLIHIYCEYLAESGGKRSEKE